MDLIEIDITENLETIEVSVQEGSIVVSGSGEANTSSSAGGTSLVLAKSGVDLPFKGLTAGTNITFGVGATALTINASSPITASNGLTKTADNIALGGTLTGNTAIDTDGKDFAITSTSNGTITISNRDGTDSAGFLIEADNSILSITDGSTISQIGLSAVNTILTYNDGGTSNTFSFGSTITLTDAINSKGIVYAGAYKANFTTYSLVDKDYVDTEIAALSSDNIQDAAGTTGLFTEETADRLVGHSTGTGTDLIFEMFEGTGTPVSVFQINAVGNLLNNSEYTLATLATSTVVVGTHSAHASIGAANYNTFVGDSAGNSIVSGDNSVLLGYNSGNALTSGTGNIFLGYFSGKNQTTVSNTFLLANRDLTTPSGELTNSLMYGVFDASKANQTLTFNAVTKVSSTAAGNPFVVDVSGTEVFQVNPAGILSNNGVEYYQYIASGTHVFGGGDIYTGSGNNNIFVGTSAGKNYTNGFNNSVLGFQAGLNLTGGDYNVLIGPQAGYLTYAGDNNVCIGNVTGYKINGADNNTYLGAKVGYNTTGASNLFLGYGTGYRQTATSNTLLVSNNVSASAAAELTNSIIYGVMDAAPANQDLTFNANVFLSQIKSGATQVASGAAANEIWKTASHATLPDNVLMIGV